MNSLELVEKIESEFVECKPSDDGIIISFKQGIEKETLLDDIKLIYDFENDENAIVFMNLKGLDTSLIIEAIKYSLTREDLRNPYMLLNIINLIKIYNTLDDSFFQNDKIYVSSIEDLLDIKLDLTEEISKFQRQLSIYFISLFKSYNKTQYEPLDKHIDLPNIYKNIIMASDILTLSGIFSVSEPFSTSECIYINDASMYMTSLLSKGSLSVLLMNNLLGEVNANKTT